MTGKYKIQCGSSQQHRTKVEVTMTLGNNICQQLIQLKNYIMYHNNLAKNKPRLCITLKVLIYIDNNMSNSQCTSLTISWKYNQNTTWPNCREYKICPAE